MHRALSWCPWVSSIDFYTPSPSVQALSMFQSILLSLGQSINHDNALYISNYYISIFYQCQIETRTPKDYFSEVFNLQIKLIRLTVKDSNMVKQHTSNYVNIMQCLILVPIWYATESYEILLDQQIHLSTSCTCGFVFLFYNLCHIQFSICFIIPSLTGIKHRKNNILSNSNNQSVDIKFSAYGAFLE